MEIKESYTAKEILRQCNKKGITVKELAPMVGMSYTGLYSSIKKNTLRAETLQKIARFFNVSISKFFEEDYVRTDSCTDQAGNIQKLQAEIEEKEKTILFLKEKVNNIYDFYWTFVLSLDDKDTARFYKNDKLTKFEKGVVFTVLEILTMVAETKDERERFHSLMKLVDKWNM